MPCLQRKIFNFHFLRIYRHFTIMGLEDIRLPMLLLQLKSLLQFRYQTTKKTDSSGDTTVGEHFKFERKDVWDMKWAEVLLLFFLYL